MSYNPAFVADECPLASSNLSQSNGIKLTSFKVLPSQSQNVVLNISQSGDNNANHHQNRSHQHHQHQHHHHQHQHQHRQPRSSSKRNNNNIKSNQIIADSTTTTDIHNTTARINGDAGGGGRHTIKPLATSVNGKPTTNKSSNNFCMSTSSSLSLIDNPTLSSLTPSSNSSYPTSSSTSSSIVSTSAGLCAAVECRDMRYDVGRGRNQKTILYNINVTVPEGSIYGLLGPSGCGKTTMLRCVVGRIKPKEGYVRVFGYQPNQSGSQIPGPAIGYMPQVS